MSFFASLIRRSAAPLAVRLVGLHHHTTTTTATAALLLSSVKYRGSHQLCRRFFPSLLHFSTQPPASDKALLRFLDSEIECADEEPEAAEDVPEEFPFKIVDNSGEVAVKLTRQYEDETVEVDVYMPELGAGEDEDEDDKDDPENSQQTPLPLIVKISKDVGPTLEFSCNATSDQILIDGLYFKNPEASEDVAYNGPDFGDLDESLQKAFYKYLNVRGITPKAMNFMHDYMVNKDSREYKTWLKNLKAFVEA